MKYEFPVIDHLFEVLEAIKDRDEFIVAEREGFSILNYLVNFEDTFPTPDTKDPALNRLYALRRECRGLKFYPDGTVAARPYHKFHNMNERPETLETNVDFTQPFDILEKLDGSMVHPIVLKDKLFWCTKMGITDVVKPVLHFMEANSSMKYDKFGRDMLDAGYTPIYEWCSRQQRIVVDYPEDQLVLTALRHTRLGTYSIHDELVQVAEPYGFPIVKAWPGDFEGIAEFVAATEGNEDEEGYVMRFHTGHCLKMKNSWYCRIHKVKELLEFEKDVIGLILRDEQDDAKVFMLDEDKEAIDRFTEKLFVEMKATAERLEWIVIAARDNLNDSKKRFALEVALPHVPPVEKGLLFEIWDGYDPLEAVKNLVLTNTGSSTKVEHIRPLIGGIKWKRY